MPAATSQYRLQQISADLHERALPGGVFYLLGWLLLAGFGGMFERRPLLCSALLVGFALAAAVRFPLRARAAHDPGGAAAQLPRLWAVLLATSAGWGAVSVWALLDPAFVGTDLVNLVTTVALATAFAQVFPIDLARGTIGTLLIYVPPLAVVWLQADKLPVAVAMSLHLAYLGTTLVRSHREYHRRLELDVALRVERDRFEALSRLDPLTGLSNRRRFAEVLEQDVAQAAAGGALSLLIVDLDHFKAVNDRYGHASGDACLREVAERLRDTFAAASVVARIGGEEFGVTLPEGGAAALELAEAFRERLRAQPVDAGASRIPLTASIGLAAYDPARQRGSEGLFRAADRALYAAKEGGRDRTVVDGVGAEG
jgi:diguanylate cyclase (GGDEF)-like protein